jgi:hypothetical protein
MLGIAFELLDWIRSVARHVANVTLTRQPTAEPPRRKLQYRVRAKDDQLGAQIEWAGQSLSRIESWSLVARPARVQPTSLRWSTDARSTNSDESAVKYEEQPLWHRSES